MHKKKFFVTAVAMLLALMAAAAEKAPEGTSLWDYADPAADVVVHINTRQPEKAMDKKLWDRISRDKERAIAEDPEERLFDTKGRDIELVANMRISSVSPFRASIEGVADITGDLQGDIAKLLGALKENQGPAPRTTKQGDLRFHDLSLPAMGQMPPMDVMFVPIGGNRIQFRINLAPQSDMLLQTLEPARAEDQLLARFRTRELAFACAVRTEKFSAAPLADTENARKLNAFLKKLRSLCVSGYVDGVFLNVDAELSFAEEGDAADLADKARAIMSRLLAATGTKEAPKIVLNGKRLAVSFRINIADSWTMISRVTGATPGKTSKEEPKNSK